MSDPSPSGEDAWRVLYSVVKDDELVLAMRASRHPNCQWLIGWLDDVFYPWRAAHVGPLRPPANHATRFFPLINGAIAAARRDMEATAAEFARLWPPAWPADLPDEPMLPGAANWPVAPPPASRRRRSRAGQKQSPSSSKAAKENCQ
jgi:hypothetical protein